VGTKADKGGRAVRVEEAEAEARRFEAGYCEVSSKTGENVRTPFLGLVDRIVSSPELMSSMGRVGDGGVVLGGEGGGGGMSCGC